MELTHQEVFQRYIYAGAISRNPDAVAELFTSDGVYEVPLEPRRLEGREAIRAGIVDYQRQPEGLGTVNMELSRAVLHDTTDPAVFIAEIDTVLDRPDGTRGTMSLVQIFRVRGDRIAHLRDYFTL
ncbi:nuclear transport factor 2 family protein [Actinoplanes sp. NPDC026619]|uniref:nuclear transport factor 2 family protein n=1 Tax=Actinoplanes sp. NPDC026619 TaxID=3155798 RepID=UPI0033D374AB